MNNVVSQKNYNKEAQSGARNGHVNKELTAFITMPAASPATTFFITMNLPVY
jgi:hypothetical protein